MKSANARTVRRLYRLTKDFQPDWVLMDWEMKEMDGITATKEILRMFPKAHILMFTQYDDLELRASAAEAGVSGYISKDNLFGLREFFLMERRRKFRKCRMI